MNNGAGTGLRPLPGNKRPLNANNSALLPSEPLLADIGNAIRPPHSILGTNTNINWTEARRHYAANDGSANNKKPFEFLPATPVAPISYEQLVTRFSNVLGLSAEDTRQIIGNLNPETNTTDFFIKMSEKLPRFTKKQWFLSGLRKKTDTLRVEKKGKTTVKNVIYKKMADSGAYGNLYISEDNMRAYKSIRFEYSAKKGPIQNFFETKIREVFYEAFIQTILSSDRLYGRFILPVEGIFYEEAAEPNVRTIIIQMPKLWSTLSSAIEKMGEKHNIAINYMYIRHVLKSITEALIHFKQLYGFRHCDLHMGNIMYRDSELREPYIIDFGRSCLTFNGIAYYRRIRSRARCESNDMLMLLVHILSVSDEAYSKNILFLDDSVYANLFNALVCADPRYNFYTELLERFRRKYKYIFHAIYPSEMNPGGPVYNHFEAAHLLPLPHIDTPEAFLAYLDNVDKETLENFETPATRHELGPETTERRARRYRISTMAFRNPLTRGKGTRHLVGGRRRSRRRLNG